MSSHHSHHNHHRSSHQSRSRSHHSSHYQSISNRSRTSSSNLNSSAGGGASGGINNGGGGGGGGGGPNNSNRSNQRISESRDPTHDWSEHRSSSGKVYYYNTRTGVSQWEIPTELRLLQKPSSPDSEISESSSIRQQQDNSPSSTASSHDSAQSDLVHEDKPLLTPSLAQYYKPELIVSFNSSQVEETERKASEHARDAIMLSEKILKESVELKIAKAVVHYVEISLDAQEKKYATIRNTIEKFGFAL